MTSSQVKITCYFHMWKDHRCYGYIINRALCRKKIVNCLSEMVWYFIGVYTITRTQLLHGRLEIRHFSSSVENISLLCCTHLWNIFQYSERNFVSLRSHVIYSICYLNRASDRVRQKMGNSAARKVYYAANYAIFLKLI